MIGTGKRENGAGAEVANQPKTKVELEAEADREKSGIPVAMTRAEDRELIIHIIDAVQLHNMNITPQTKAPTRIETSIQPKTLPQI